MESRSVLPSDLPQETPARATLAKERPPRAHRYGNNRSRKAPSRIRFWRGQCRGERPRDFLVELLPGPVVAEALAEDVIQRVAPWEQRTYEVLALGVKPLLPHGFGEVDHDQRARLDLEPEFPRWTSVLQVLVATPEDLIELRRRSLDRLRSSSCVDPAAFEDPTVGVSRQYGRRPGSGGSTVTTTTWVPSTSRGIAAQRGPSGPKYLPTPFSKIAESGSGVSWSWPASTPSSM